MLLHGVVMILKISSFTHSSTITDSWQHVTKKEGFVGEWFCTKHIYRKDVEIVIWSQLTDYLMAC